jgi:hypothetical protein
MAAYCTSADLLINPGMRMPVEMDKNAYVQQAASEIDMRIGRLYKTPVAFGTIELQERYSATTLFLKHLNIHLATGRLIMALDLSGEQTQLHAYGKSLVDGAMALLEEIVAREIVLEGAPTNDNDPDLNANARPYISQVDAVSGVEAFYAIVQTPYVISWGDGAESRPPRW